MLQSIGLHGATPLFDCYAYLTFYNMKNLSVLYTNPLPIVPGLNAANIVSNVVLCTQPHTRIVIGVSGSSGSVVETQFQPMPIFQNEYVSHSLDTFLIYFPCVNRQAHL